MNELTARIFTPQDRDIVLDFLDEMERGVHNVHVDMQQLVFQKAPVGLGQYLSEQFGNILAGSDTIAVREKIKSLKSELTGLPTVAITIARPYERDSFEALAQRLLETIGKKVLIELVVDPTVIGGAIIEGNGRVTNATVKEYFVQKNTYGF